MDLDIGADTTDMATDTPDTDTTARGPLMPSPLLMLRLMPMLTTDTTAMPAPTPMDTDTDTPDTDTTARGPLRPSPRLRLRLRPMPLSSMVPTDTPMASVPMAMAPSDTLDTPMA